MDEETLRWDFTSLCDIICVFLKFFKNLYVYISEAYLRFEEESDWSFYLGVWSFYFFIEFKNVYWMKLIPIPHGGTTFLVSINR